MLNVESAAGLEVFVHGANRGRSSNRRLPEEMAIVSSAMAGTIKLPAAMKIRSAGFRNFFIFQRSVDQAIQHRVMDEPPGTVKH